MAYTSINASGQARRYLGQSSDQKPVTAGSTVVLKGSLLTEADTGRDFIFDGTNWAPVISLADMAALLREQNQKLGAVVALLTQVMARDGMG